VKFSISCVSNCKEGLLKHSTMGCYDNTNAFALTEEATAYVGHISFALILLYVSVVSQKIRIVMPWVVRVIFMGVALSILFQTNGYFKDVMLDAQKCAQPEDNSLEWVDGSSKWLFNIPFATIWIGAALYGIAGLCEPGSFLRFEFPLAPADADSFLFRSICLLFPLSTCYAGLFLLGGGTLMKPLQQRLFVFEAPLATTLTVSGLCYFPVALFGAGLTKRRAWLSSVLSLRPLAIAVGFSACYYCIWRLNGGLNLFPSQWGENSPLRKQIGTEIGVWHHVEPLKELAVLFVESIGSF